MAPQSSSTCSGDSWQRGRVQRVIAFVFYGNPELIRHNTTYFEGIRANVAAISSLYQSNWSIRLYHDLGPENPWLTELCKIACKFDRLDLCRVNQLPHPLLSNATDMFPMLWRFFPTLDPQVDVFMSRDLDSALTPRELGAVDEWLESGKTLHVMRDHPLHSNPMLGGLWGARLRRSRTTWKSIWTSILADPLSRSSRTSNGPDQTLLKRYVWKKLAGGVIQHDSYFCKKWPEGSLGFPSQRLNGTDNFVGAYRSYKPIWLECPKACRRQQNWTFC